MPFHLELGSEGHSFHGKAIVVNSKTGEHKTKAPLPLDLAKAQMKALENKEAPPAPKAKKETHDDYKGPRNKDGTPKKSTKAWGMYVRDRDRPKPEMMKAKHEAQKEDIPEREGEGPKEVKAKAEDTSKLFEAIYRLVEKRIDRELDGEKISKSDLSSDKIRYLINHIIGDNDAITKATQDLTTKHNIVPGSKIDEYAEAYWRKRVKEMMEKQAPEPKKKMEGGGGGGGGGVGGGGGGGPAVAEGMMSYAEVEEKWNALEVERKRLDKLWREQAAIDGSYDSPYYATRNKKDGVAREQDALIRKIDGSTVPSIDRIPKEIRDLKEGDTITYGQSSGYMGDGGDSRDVGYSVTRKILKVLGRGKYEVDSHYKGNKPEVFTLTDDKNWLRDVNRGRLGVYEINGKGKDDISGDRFQTKWLEELRDREDKERRSKKQAKAAEKEKEDWTTSPKQTLINLIDAHFAAQGKRMSNLGTATKPKLIEIIRKYKIKE